MNISEEEKQDIADAMDNSSLAMDEEQISLFGIRAVVDLERELTAAFADGVVTSQESIRIFRKTAVVGSSVHAQLETDRKDIALGKRICERAVERSQQKERAAGEAAQRSAAAQL